MAWTSKAIINYTVQSIHIQGKNDSSSNLNNFYCKAKLTYRQYKTEII